MRRRTGSIVGIALAALLLTSSTSTAHPRSQGASDRLDLVSSAQPTPESPRLEDTAYDDEWTSARDVDAQTVSTSSSTCDGCSGVARTVEVVYVRHGQTVRADNVATAWARCTGCDASALSVQVVILRRPAELRVNNRALAVDTTCGHCTSSAAAYQLVVSSRARPDLDALRDQLETWAEEITPAPLPLAPRGPALGAATPGAAPQDTLDALQAMVATEAPGPVLEASQKVQE